MSPARAGDLKLSLFTLLDHYPGRADDVGTLLRDAVQRAVLAEELGYDAVWFAEHHFRDFGALPNPAVLLAAIAQCTERIRLGPAVAVLPFKHPLQSAEDYLLVDQLSSGRLNLGVGSGSVSWEFDGFGMQAESKAHRFTEAIEALRPVLRGDTANLRGTYVQIDNIRSNVPPHQPGGPPVFVATNRVENAGRVGQSGDNLLTLVSPDTPGLGTVDERVASYRAGAGQSDQPAGKVAVAIMAHVGATDEAAVDASREPMVHFLQSHAGIDRKAAEGVHTAMIQRGTGLIGSAETVTQGLSDLAARGADEVILWMDFGGMNRETLDASIRTMAEKVRPRASAGTLSS